jgi:hypothetical protein
MYADQRERGRAVVERPLRPDCIGNLVTALARGREARGRVVRVSRVGVVGLVAGDAGRGRSRIDAALVARLASLSRVDPDEGERGRAVTERCLVPVDIAGFVAALARGREARGRVVRVPGVGVVGLVTGDAGGGLAVVDTIPVARRARLGSVHSDQRERGMGKCRLRPRGVGCLVTLLAGRREPRRHVCGLARGLEVSSVAPEAVGGDPGREDLIDVAGLAHQRPVAGVEGEARRSTVVPDHGAPRGRPMAALTLHSETRAEAVVLPPDPVTVVAAVRSSLDFTVDVAGPAWNREVAVLERERRRLVERA